MSTRQPQHERHTQGSTQLIPSTGQPRVELLRSTVLEFRVVRLQWSTTSAIAPATVPATVAVSEDGSQIVRTLNVPSWGMAVGVPGALCEVYGGPSPVPGVDLQWVATLSPGLPVLEHVGQVAPQVPTPLTPPAFARTATVLALGAAGTVQLASGVVAVLALGVPLTIPAQVITCTPGLAGEVSVIWEVYQ